MKSQTLNERDTAFFTCQVTGTPIPKIIWYLNGAPVDMNNTMKYIISDMLLNDITKSATLTVVNILPSDNGTYTCKATNFASNDSSSGVLNVNSKYKECALIPTPYHRQFCIFYSSAVKYI